MVARLIGPENVKMLEALESRVHFNAVSVSLYSAAGTPVAAIDRHLALFVLVHGDGMTVGEMTDMAAAVQDQLPADQYQVVIVDWNQPPSPPSNFALEVGDSLAGMIKASRIPASRVNLIGFSMGGPIIGQTAKDLKSGSGEVNRIIGIDPASPRFEPAAYAANSSYSICFCGDDGYAHTASSLSADDAILLTNLSSDNLDRHVGVFTTVANIWQRDAGLISDGDQAVSSLFSITSILDGTPPPWKRSSIDSGFDAVMTCDGNDSDPTPTSLTYVNTRGHMLLVE
jgi:hypothetical protein